LDVAYVCNDFEVFSSVFLRSKFQVFHLFSFVCCKSLDLDISKVDRAGVVDLHLVGVDQISGSVSRLHSG
jgi:hypothetical protein